MCCGCGIFSFMTVFVSFSAGFLTASALAFGLFSFLEWDERPRLKNNTEDFHMGETNYAVDLREEVRVLCMVLIKSEDLSKAKRIKFTWGKRCNELIFFGNKEDSSLPVVPLKFGRSLDSWGVTKSCLDYVYKNKSKTNFDWILKTDDETYTVVENLRYLLTNYSSSEPIYVDDIIQLESKETVKLVKLGYVISKSGLEKIIEEESKCEPLGNEMEGYYVNRCLDKIGLKEVNSKDCLGRLRFLPIGLRDIFRPYSTYKWTGLYQPNVKDKPCCSDFAVLFHRVTDYEIYVLEYLIYHLTPYGISPNTDVDLNNCTPVHGLLYLSETQTDKI